MKANVLTLATALSDGELLTRIESLARTERESTAELVGHLAVLESRPSAYAALGYGSLFNYCVDGLRLSEDAASTRIAVARLCRRFPALLQMLSSGALNLTAARTLGPHLTPQNYQAVLARAARQRHEGIEELVAEISPRPDVKATIRRLPSPTVPASAPAEGLLFADVSTVAPAVASAVDTRIPPPSAAVVESQPAPYDEPCPPSVMLRRRDKARMQALSPERYRVQFTIGQDTHDAVKRLQALMRRELPSGDIAAIFEQGVQLLLEKVQRAKLGGTRTTRAGGPGPRRVGGSATDKGQAPEGARGTGGSRAREGSSTGQSRSSPPTSPAVSVVDSSRATYENRIRFETDKQSPRRSRHIPNAVKRAVWWRDRAQCAFVSAAGLRCTEQSYLELHHIHPYALDGPTTVHNVSLRCRRHNRYEAEVVFGARAMAKASEGARD